MPEILYLNKLLMARCVYYKYSIADFFSMLSAMLFLAVGDFLYCGVWFEW